jgi:hypothetical protein
MNHAEKILSISEKKGEREVTRSEAAGALW